MDFSVWLRILRRVRAEFRDDQLALVAAGVAFYWLLAIFPALAATVSIAGVFGDPQAVTHAFGTYGGLVPPDVVELLHGQISAVSAANTTQVLEVGAVLGFGAALWAANNGVKGIVSGVNVAWDLPETRSFLSTNLTGFALLVLGLGVASLASLAFAALPMMSGLPGPAQVMVDGLMLARWPIVAFAMVAYLSVLYRVAPCRRAPPRLPITPGAVAGTICFLLASAAFSAYVESFGTYNQTYGNLGGAVVLLLWFWVAALSVLFGAELDAEIEREFLADKLETVPMHRDR